MFTSAYTLTLTPTQHACTPFSPIADTTGMWTPTCDLSALQLLTLRPPYTQDPPCTEKLLEMELNEKTGHMVVIRQDWHVCLGKCTS